MTRIAHIAIQCGAAAAVERAARFHENVFGLRRTASDASDSLRLTDGDFDITLLAGSGRPRISRIGIATDDVSAAKAKLAQYGGAILAERGGAIPFRSPDGVAGEIVAHGRYGGDAPSEGARIVHVAIKVMDLEAETRFYENVFGFRTLSSGHARGHVSRHMAAGETDLALMLYDNEEVPESQLAGAGPCIHHFGLEVDDRVATASAIAAQGGEVLSRPEKGAWKFRAPDGAIGEIVERKGFEIFRTHA